MSNGNVINLEETVSVTRPSYTRYLEGLRSRMTAFHPFFAEGDFKVKYAAFIDEVFRASEEDRYNMIDERQADILKMRAEGYTLKQVAASLSLSPSYVRELELGAFKDMARSGAPRTICDALYLEELEEIVGLGDDRRRDPTPSEQFLYGLLSSLWDQMEQDASAVSNSLQELRKYRFEAARTTDVGMRLFYSKVARNASQNLHEAAKADKRLLEAYERLNLA